MELTIREKLDMEMTFVMDKMKSGEELTTNDREIIRIWTQLTGGKSGRAGKRVDPCKPKKARG